MFSLAYVPKQIVDYDNPELTFNNILNKETLFMLGIASSVICYTAFIFLPIVLHLLFRPVNELYSKAMMVLAVISVPISFINLHNKYAILSIVSDSKLKTVTVNDELYQQIMMYLNSYDNGIFLTTLFWGLWLLPFGYLVFKSGFLPRILGVLLILGCFGYLINFFGNTLSGNYSSYVISKYLRFLPAIAEIGTCLWLLIIGIKVKTSKL
jgi:hypothetical protein